MVGTTLYGREAETASLDALLHRARAGRSAVLVLRGAAGIGKSALLDWCADTAADFRVLRGCGVPSESGLPYAGLNLLLGGQLDRLNVLPEAQAGALRAALGVDPEGSTDRFQVWLAVLSLLAELAEDRPLLVLVDDAHWLDHSSAEALQFAARRLQAEPLVMLFAVRAGDGPDFPTPGLRELRLAALDEQAATRVVADRAGSLPAYQVNGLLRRAEGNPLALLELPVEIGSGQPVESAPSSSYEALQRAFVDRAATLPEATRTLLLVAAADETGDPGLVLEAAARLGVSPSDLDAAERSRLVAIDGGRLRFRHPLIRTALYQVAPLRERSGAHRALAAVLTDRGDACLRVWHLAAAATEPDEEVAAALERLATSGVAGDHSAAAAILEESARITPEAGRRGKRLVAAAKAAAEAGTPQRAGALADRAADDARGPSDLAEVAVVRAGLLVEDDRSKEAHRLLADAAVAVAATAPDTAGKLLFGAAVAASHAGDTVALTRTAERAEALGVVHAGQVRALATAFSGPVAHGVDAGTGSAALHALLEAAGDDPERRLEAGWWHLLLADADTAYDIASSLARECRDAGRIGQLARVLPLLARTELLTGRTGEARSTGTEALRIALDTGQRRHAVYVSTVLALLAAVVGDEDRCAELAAEPLARGVAPGAVHAAGALSLLDLGLGRHEAAFARLSGILSGPNPQGSLASLPDFVEAAVRLERGDAATEAAERFAAWAAHVDRPWTRAVALRCRALLAPESEAGGLFEDAVALHALGGPPFEQARTDLLAGEWLRRMRRRTDARVRLHAAVDIFVRLGARPWAERARGELRATGESVADATGGTDLLARLTPQEAQVVRLAARGLSNREIGGQLFLSPRTVGYHLYNAYPKLGVATRGELAATLA